MNKEISILGAGLSCIDLIYNGTDVNVSNGGTCANVLSVLSLLGWNTTLIKPVYNDVLDDFMNTNFNSLGVKVSNSKTVRTKCPRIIQKINKKSHRFFIECPECKKKILNLPSLDIKNIENLELRFDEFDIFFYDRISSGIREIVEIMHKKNKIVFYEPNSSRNPSILIKDCLKSDIVKFSKSRVPYKIAEEIRNNAYGNHTKIIILTDSDNGLLFTYKKDDNYMSDWIEIPPFISNNIVDTSGAGDWFSAGFLYKLLSEVNLSEIKINEDSIVNATSIAKQCASICCKIVGAQSAFYNEQLRDELEILCKYPINSNIKVPSISSYQLKCNCTKCLV